LHRSGVPLCTRKQNYGIAQCANVESIQNHAPQFSAQFAICVRSDVIDIVVMDGRHGAQPLTQPEERARTMFISLLRNFRAWWRYETAVRDLLKLNDRELIDLGITRNDVDRVALEQAGGAPTGNEEQGPAA